MKSYSITTDYQHIDIALKSFWKPFNELLTEMDSFEPLPLSAFDDKRAKLFEHMRKLNPDKSDEELNEFTQNQIYLSESAGSQFRKNFSERFMTMQVTVTLLSQALCEAEVNAILAAGLYEHGSPDLFVDIQRADVKEKWINGPKYFCPKYELKKGSTLYETLNHLNKQRNAWMHHKSHLQVEEEKIIEGSKLEKFSYKNATRWIKRYFSLPYDLAAHVHEHTHQSISMSMFFKRNPIPVADAHK